MLNSTSHFILFNQIKYFYTLSISISLLFIIHIHSILYLFPSYTPNVSASFHSLESRPLCRAKLASNDARKAPPSDGWARLFLSVSYSYVANRMLILSILV